jgi:selenocysteine-specific elongation factor
VARPERSEGRGPQRRARILSHRAALPYNKRMATDLILGTAGHIDHGKTALVKALTGVDTDRLPEEKLRGITIELGFAELALGDCRLGIVDVPGHERFVRNMLAGATGIDVALLVVAADDSVKPQTREHLEILRLLDLEAGVIALTKCDLPEPAWISLVEDEVRDLVSDTFLASAPLVRTSVVTGAGLEELRAALAQAAHRAAGGLGQRRIDAPFRMAIDRVFTIAGHGTVVTGSVASGRVRVGDELELQPGAVLVRVRGLQHHEHTVEELHRGQRAAINLAGVRHDEVLRGQELAASGYLVPSKVISLELKLLESALHPLKDRSRVRCHLGTAELMASVALLEGERLEPGQSGFAQLHLAEPAVAVWGQPLVLRSESPVITVGGGRVLDPHAARMKRGFAEPVEQLHRLASTNALDRAGAAVYFTRFRDWQPRDLTRVAGVLDPDATLQALLGGGEVQEIAISPSRSLRVHRMVLEEIYERIEAVLSRQHDHEPLRIAFDKSPLARQFEYLGSDALVDALLAAMSRDGRLVMDEKGVALPGRGPQLSRNERALLTQIVEIYRRAGSQPPTIEDVQQQAPRNQAAVPQLIALAAAAGDLVAISPEFYLHAEAERRIRQLLEERLSGGHGLTVSQIREILGTSRKYAVPICEHLDRVGFTRREGDVRMRVERATA